MSRKAAAKTDSRAELMRKLQFLGQMQSSETAHFHQLAADSNGMNITDSKTVSVLMQEGSMTAGQLAVRLSLTTGAVTSVIDRLENLGFVERTRDPEDKRRVIVSLDYSETAKISKTYDSMGHAFQKLLGDYSTEQLRFLVGFFESAITMAQAETQKLNKF
jgi:MarR family transcriptional regulator, organic hydroperoxide resistance regulator